MERVDSEYYKGFEGEPEIQFICRKGNDSETFIIWEGYFNQIMRLIEPDNDGWKGLAYYYHMYSGWYEESPWTVPDLYTVLKQFELLNDRMLCDEAGQILRKMCDMFKKAIIGKYEIFIGRE